MMNDLPVPEEEEDGEELAATGWSQEEEDIARTRRKKLRLSIDDVIQASNLFELCEKKGIVQENLSGNDYCQYIKTRKLLEKQNEIPPQYQSGLFSSGGKRDAPFEYSPFFEWQRSLLERMITKRPPDDKRKIIFLVDPIGNNGKSVFFQWLSSLPAGAINKYLSTDLFPDSRVPESPSSIHRTDDSMVSQKELLSSHTSVAIIKEEEEDLKERLNIKQYQDFEEELIKKENCMPTSENNNNSQQEEIGEHLSEKIPREEEEEISCRSRENQSIIFPGNNDDDNNSLLSLKDFRSRTVPPPIMNMMNIEFQYLTIEGGGSKSSSVNDILYLVDCKGSFTKTSLF
jgi:hypothetical protein